MKLREEPRVSLLPDAHVLLRSRQVNTLKLALEGVEKERDFYFGKLREIELLCQDQGQESAQFVDRLMEVLYSTEEQVSPLRAVPPLASHLFKMFGDSHIMHYRQLCNAL